MNVGQIKDEATLMLGNVLKQAGHPFVLPTDLRYRWITQACNKIPQMAAAGGRDILSTFGELRATWQGTTDVTNSFVSRPTEALLIREIYSFDKLAAVPDVDTERLITQLTPTEYAAGKSANEGSAWPRVWTGKEQRVYFRPKPVTLYLTDFHMYGVVRQTPVFTSDAQVPLLNEDWHEALVVATAMIGAKRLGYFERAAQYEKELAVLIGIGVEVPAQEDLYDDPSFDLGGLLTQEDVYP